MNVAAVVDECMALLNGRYQIVACLVGGSAAKNPDTALDVDLCILVRENVFNHAKARVQGTPTDIFVCGVERARRELHEGRKQHLITFFSYGAYAYGDREALEDLQNLARSMGTQPAPQVPDAQIFAFREMPYSLLEKFFNVCERDRDTAGVILSTLVRVCVDAYFLLNRIWTSGIRDTVKTIAVGNPAGAAALSRVFESRLDTLCAEPQILRDMVTLLVGAPPSWDGLIWLARDEPDPNRPGPGNDVAHASTRDVKPPPG